jgi:hypothetical protein
MFLFYYFILAKKNKNETGVVATGTFFIIAVSQKNKSDTFFNLFRYPRTHIIVHLARVNSFSASILLKHDTKLGQLLWLQIHVMKCLYVR